MERTKGNQQKVANYKLHNMALISKDKMKFYYTTELITLMHYLEERGLQEEIKSVKTIYYRKIMHRVPIHLQT